MEQKIEMNRVEKNPDVNYRRLYGEFNRETIQKMKERGFEIAEEPYDISEVMRYLEDKDNREKDKLTDRNAMKAQMFSEWLAEKGLSS